LKEDLKPAEEDFFAITAPCAALAVRFRKKPSPKMAEGCVGETTPDYSYLSRWPNRFVNHDGY